MKKRVFLALPAGLVVFVAVFGLAASLGGITSTSVGADSTAVASCDSDGVAASYTTAWDATDSRYEVTAVTVSGVADTCDGQTLAVSLTNASGTQIGSGSLTIPASAATSHTVSLSPTPSAELVEGVHVVIAS